MPNKKKEREKRYYTYTTKFYIKAKKVSKDQVTKYLSSSRFTNKLKKTPTQLDKKQQALYNKLETKYYIEAIKLYKIGYSSNSSLPYNLVVDTKLKEITISSLTNSQKRLIQYSKNIV